MEHVFRTMPFRISPIERTLTNTLSLENRRSSSIRASGCGRVSSESVLVSTRNPFTKRCLDRCPGRAQSKLRPRKGDCEKRSAPTDRGNHSRNSSMVEPRSSASRMATSRHVRQIWREAFRPWPSCGTRTFAPKKPEAGMPAFSVEMKVLRLVRS